jgi:hypothetical protein
MTLFRQVPFLMLVLAACSTATDQPAEELAAGRGGGVVLHGSAVTYVGSGSFCTRPATIDVATVLAATPEWREIQRDGVAEGSARHALLKAGMHNRVVAACRKAASARGNDLVVRAGDIADARGLPVTDLTSAVLSSL